MLFEEKNLKKLARSDYFQTLISNKELGFKLFANDYDFSSLQILFLSLVSRYNSLYLDIAMGDVNFLVLKEDIYSDAYLVYKSKKREKDKKERNNPTQKPKQKEEKKGSGFKWIFKTPKE
jgi:hypothetical protein